MGSQNWNVVNQNGGASSRRAKEEETRRAYLDAAAVIGITVVRG
jgi:hypothetical protein